MIEQWGEPIARAFRDATGVTDAEPLPEPENVAIPSTTGDGDGDG